jgi:hypothetical protein
MMKTATKKRCGFRVGRTYQSIGYNGIERFKWKCVDVDQRASGVQIVAFKTSGGLIAEGRVKWIDGIATVLHYHNMFGGRVVAKIPE